MTQSLAIGVDLGATKIASVLITPDGEIVRANRIATRPDEGVTSVLDRVADEINGMIGVANGHLLGVGIGSPGLVDTGTGVVLESVNLDWTNVAVGPEIARRLDAELPIWLQTDTIASALGEFYFGAGKGCSAFVYLSIGTGLGGGVVLNGEVLTGAHGLAGGIGHFSLDPEGLPCMCGLTGCAETIASGHGLLRVARRLLDEGRHETTLGGDALSPRAVVEAARDGDALAQAALAEIGRTLGLVMAPCVALLDPDRFVIGGGLGLGAFDFLSPAAQEELRRRVLPINYQHVEVVPSGLASSAIGASCLVWSHLEHESE